MEVVARVGAVMRNAPETPILVKADRGLRYEQVRTLMDLLAERQKIVASNVANVDTPGYKSKDIDFEHEYLSLTAGGRPSPVEGRARSRPSSPTIRTVAGPVEPGAFPSGKRGLPGRCGGPTDDDGAGLVRPDR